MSLKSLHRANSSLLHVQQVLMKAGYIAWLAGGCVRDAILGVTPQDFDLVTNASVEQVEGLFPRTVLVGAQFGVLRVVHDGEEFEVAQFRKESDYRDGRHPSLVESAGPEEDAFRRDLTVNALFYDPNEECIYDYVGGLQDLNDRVLRAVGDAQIRFNEDHLRVLRAIRFRAQLNFTWSPELEKAILKNVPLVAGVSRERVRDELQKMTDAKWWSHLPEFLVSSSVLTTIFPGSKWEADAHRNLQGKSFVSATSESVPLQSFNLNQTIWWEWALWGRLSGQTTTEVLRNLESLKLSRNELKSIANFLSWFGETTPWSQLSLGVLIEKLFEPGAREGLHFWATEFLPDPSHSTQMHSSKVATSQAEMLQREVIHQETIEKVQNLLMLSQKWPQKPAPWVRAKDLFSINPDLQGIELGKILKDAFHRQLTGADQNREAALACILKKV